MQILFRTVEAEELSDQIIKGLNDIETVEDLLKQENSLTLDIWYHFQMYIEIKKWHRSKNRTKLSNNRSNGCFANKSARQNKSSNCTRNLFRL